MHVGCCWAHLKRASYHFVASVSCCCRVSGFAGWPASLLLIVFTLCPLLASPFFPLVRPITLWGSVLNLPVCYSGLDHHSSLVSHHPAQSRAMCPRLPASIPNTYFHACSPIGNIAKCRSKYSCVWAVPTMVPCLAFQSSCLLDEDPYISCMRVARPSLHPVHYLPIPCTEIGAQHVVWHAYCTLTFLWGGSLA